MVGRAGGNGFDRVIAAGVERLVGIDIKAEFIETARARHANAAIDPELHRADIRGELPAIPAADLVYVALVPKYVNVEAAMGNIARLCRPGGRLVVMPRKPSDTIGAISPSPYSSSKASRRSCVAVRRRNWRRSPGGWASSANPRGESSRPPARNSRFWSSDSARATDPSWVGRDARPPWGACVFPVRFPCSRVYRRRSVPTAPPCRVRSRESAPK